MKKIALPLIAAAMVALVGCQSKSTLMTDIQGSWSSDNQRIAVNGFYDANVIKTYQFMPDSTATITAMISVEKALPDTDTMVEPVSMTASATATVSGTYVATSYDKVEIKLDMSTLQVSVDPSAVNFMYNGLTTDETPALGELSATYIEQLKDELTPVMKVDFVGSSVLTDIKFVKTPASLTCTIDATPTTLTKN